jgi:hypothetical protein
MKRRSEITLEINIFLTVEDWAKDNAVPNETLEGSVKPYRNTFIIQTYEEGKRYTQLISPFKVFAITHKQPYGYFDFDKDIFVYLSYTAWSNSEPEYCLKGQLSIDDCANGFVVINTSDGYRQYISQDKIFALVCEE